jgi:hypothetical protein
VRNPGLPDPATVVGERVLVSPKGRRYRILEPSERDPGDPPGDDGRDARGPLKRPRP